MAEQISTNPQRYLRREEAAGYLRDRGVPCTKNTLAKQATVGGGPIFRKFGPTPLYTPEDLDTYIDQKLTKPVRSTSELQEPAHAA